MCDVLSARTCSYGNLSSASEVVDVALALVPLPRVESKGALDEPGRIPWGGMSGMAKKDGSQRNKEISIN